MHKEAITKLEGNGMTLCIALITKDCIILAADTRTVQNLPISTSAIWVPSNDSATKLRSYCSNYGVAFCGAIGAVHDILDSLALSGEHTKLEGGGTNNIPIREATTHLSSGLREAHANGINLGTTTLIAAGYTMCADSQMPQIYRLSYMEHFDLESIPKGYICEGLVVYAEYILSRYYDERIDSSVGKLLSAYCIKETYSQNNCVGANISLAEIRPDGGFKLCEPEVNEMYSSQAEELHLSRLKAFRNRRSTSSLFSSFFNKNR